MTHAFSGARRIPLQPWQMTPFHRPCPSDLERTVTPADPTDERAAEVTT